MDEQEAIYQKLCQFEHTSYEMSERGEKSKEIDNAIRAVLEGRYHGQFEHADDRCLECQYEVEIMADIPNEI